MTDQQHEHLWPCPRCQTPIPTTSAFCPKCGLQLTGAPAAPAAPEKKASPLQSALGCLVVIGIVIVVAGYLTRGNTAPGADPTPPPAAGVSFSEFAAHVSSAASDFAEITGDVGRAAQSQDIATLRTEVDNAVRATTTELSWLRANQPQACYRPVHEAWRQAMLKYQESFEAIQFGLRPPITTSDIERGTRLMSEAGELLDTANLLVQTTDC